MNPPFSRRGFLKTAAIGTAATITGLPAFSAQDKPAQAKMPFKLGVASYSLRKFDRKEAIKMTRQLGADYINIKSFHLPHAQSTRNYGNRTETTVGYR